MYVLDLARKYREDEALRIRQVREQFPTQFQQFLVMLERSVTLLNQPLTEVTPELRQLGVWCDNRGTYMKVKVPYFTVDGRVAMMVARHKDTNTPFSLCTELVQINGEWYMQAKYEGLSAEGTPCQTTGIAKIDFGGKGVNTTNPVENAETSSIGRALAFAGYGLLGTGIASADEVVVATAERQTLGEQKQQGREQDENSYLRRYFAALASWAKQVNQPFDEVKQVGKTTLYEMFNCESLRELGDQQWQDAIKNIKAITTRIDKTLKAKAKIMNELTKWASEAGVPEEEAKALLLKVLAEQGINVNDILDLKPKKLVSIAQDIDSYLTSIEVGILFDELNKKEDAETSQDSYQGLEN